MVPRSHPESVEPARQSTLPAALGWTTSPWRSALIGGTTIWVGVRVVLTAVAAIAQIMRTGPSLSDPLGSRTIDGAGGGFFAMLHHWDSNYFLDIAANGYFHAGAAPGLPGFFPGYPLAARVLADAFSAGSPTPAGIALAMWLISAAASLTAAVVLWRLAEILGGRRMSAPAVVLFLAGPYSVFLAANYSEGLYAAFAIAAWYCAVKGRWALAGLWCAGASFTRINGVFLIAALVVLNVMQRRRSGRPLLAPAAAWPVLAIAGVGAYFGWLAARTGDLFAWNTAQSVGWGRGLHWPWQAFYQTAGRVLFASTIDRRFQFAMDIGFAAVVLIALLVWWRRGAWPEIIYAGLTLAALITSTTFVSLARNCALLFPLVFIVAEASGMSPRLASGADVRESRTESGLNRAARVGLLAAWFGLFLMNTTLFAFGFWTD